VELEEEEVWKEVLSGRRSLNWKAELVTMDWVMYAC